MSQKTRQWVSQASKQEAKLLGSKFLRNVTRLHGITYNKMSIYSWSPPWWLEIWITIYLVSYVFSTFVTYLPTVESNNTDTLNYWLLCLVLAENHWIHITSHLYCCSISKRVDVVSSAPHSNARGLQYAHIQQASLNRSCLERKTSFLRLWVQQTYATLVSCRCITYNMWHSCREKLYWWCGNPLSKERLCVGGGSVVECCRYVSIDSNG